MYKNPTGILKVSGIMFDMIVELPDHLNQVVLFCNF